MSQSNTKSKKTVANKSPVTENSGSQKKKPKKKAAEKALTPTQIQNKIDEAVSTAVAKVEAKAIAPITPQEEAAQFMNMLHQAAKDPNTDVSKMQALLDMKKDVMLEQQKAAFVKSYMEAKQVMPTITKAGIVEYGEGDEKKKAFEYAKYEDINGAIRPIEKKHGFARIFTTEPNPNSGGGCRVICTLMHDEGYFVTSQIDVALDSSGGKNNIQAMGSSFSYGKRYTTEMVWDIEKEGADDDANSAFLEMPIDEIQLTAFLQMIDDNKVDAVKFCKHLEVKSIADIAARDYPKAMADLKAHIEKKKEIEAKKKAAEFKQEGEQ